MGIYLEHGLDEEVGNLETPVYDSRGGEAYYYCLYLSIFTHTNSIS